MNVLPAKVAGVGEIIMTTPPESDGKVFAQTLVAANEAGVDKIYKAGGAQAIAALAYGTESVPRADKIVGPGNAFVAEAKRQVSGTVGIDMIAGPSEILVVADGKSNPRHLAADLLSQAEHDRMASAVLVTDSEKLARAVQAEIERQLPLLEREEIARASIEGQGKIIVTENLREAIETANQIAPEHLELCVDEPMQYLGLVRNAGSIFLGRWSPEPLGDYMAGPNHTLPTQGTAKFSSPLGVDDFIKKTQFTYYPREALNRVAEDVALFARKEGLTGHARSALSRREEQA
jgi:histidinol dehydrogenase